jgi:hypothetical protein
MTKEELSHLEANQVLIKTWITMKTKLQVSDITKPIFEAYERETGYSTKACNDCKL